MASRVVELTDLDTSDMDDFQTLQGIVVTHKTSFTRLLGPDNSTHDGI